MISSLSFQLYNSLAVFIINRFAELPELTKIEYLELFHFENCLSNLSTSFP